MGQDTYCVLVAGAPLAFTYENWPTYQKLLFDSRFEEQELFILLVTDFLSHGRDGCHDLVYYMREAFIKFLDPVSVLTQQEFQVCSENLTKQLHNYNLLPEPKNLTGLNLQILAEIQCCHVRGLTRRQNPQIFNQDYSWTSDELTSKIQNVTSWLIKMGLPESQIVINSYMWDSQ